MDCEPRQFQHFQTLVIDMHVDASSFQKVLASGETCFPRHKLRMENLIFAVAQNPLIGKNLVRSDHNSTHGMNQHR